MSTPNTDDTDMTTDVEEEENEHNADKTTKQHIDIEDSVDSQGALMNQLPAYNRLLYAEILVQAEEGHVSGKVMKQVLGPDGKVAGKYDDNPYLNSIMYEVELADVWINEYGANIIAENMLTQVDSDGFSLSQMEGIIDYKRDDSVAIPKTDKYITTSRAQRRLRKTTAGWKLLVKCRDQSESWVKLSELKESHPVETREFAKSRGIDDEPAIAWWVPHTLKKRNAIISAMKVRLQKTTHKYGIEIPTSVDHAMEIDRKNGNRKLKDALSLEMFNVGVAFEILEEGQAAPQGWNKASGHLIWDVKMDFTRKARWVLDGHKTPDPIGSTSAGVVSWESVRIAFTYAALNDLQVFEADIRNPYLQAPSSQKDYVVCGPEFGIENIGKVALIHRALYGGKSAGRDFRNHLRSCMHHLNFQSCPADPHVWMRPAKKGDGSPCYDYVLLYMDNALVISDNAESILRNEIGRYFGLKEASIGPPMMYLGAGIRKVKLDNGMEAWAASSSQYVQAVLRNVEEYIEKSQHKRWRIPNKVESPMRSTYRPELDVSEELSSYYQSLIGILRWIVELGRVDICLEVSMMSSHLALPRKGHMEQVMQMFGYQRKYHNAELVFDPSDPLINEQDFEKKDWASSEFGHVEGKEDLPPNMPEPRGLGFMIVAKVDADHASDTVTRRSRTGILVYLNCSLIHWWSKKQASIESSSFGAEFIVMKQCCEYLHGLRYKLRMMGIPCDGPSHIYGDNQSVLANTMMPDSTLKKKSQSIAYHLVREGSARGEWRTAYVNTHDNEADLLTKS